MRASQELMRSINRLKQVVEQDKAVDQTWNNLANDYPALLDSSDDGGAIKGKTFTPSEIQAAENRAKELLKIFAGTSDTVPNGNWEKIFRQLSGVV